jgi:hydrogenase-4 membrane subunit HyfE
MKGLKIFGWISLALAIVCLLVTRFGNLWEYDEICWKISVLIFGVSAIVSWLVARALKQIKEELELKMLMNG